MSAEPQPDAAAILDTLNEIARELEEGAKHRPIEPPVERPVRLDQPASLATGAAMPRVELERLTEPVARKPSGARRVVLGVFVALAYVAILAVAGLFISRAVNPIANGYTGTSLAEQASAAFAAVVTRIDTLVHRRGGDAVPVTIGPAAVSAPIEAPPQVEAAPQVAVPAVAPPPPRIEAAPQVAAPAVAPPPQAPVETQAAAPAIAIPPPESAPPPRAEPAAAPPQPSAALAPESPRAVPVERAPPAATVAPVEPAPPAAMAAPAEPAPPAATVAPAPPPAKQPTTAPAQAATAPAKPSAAALELRALGDERLRQGDVASARLFYERAADAGDARAALMLGGTYDAAFLEQLGARGMRGDAAQAASWYRRARELGEPEADTRLQSLAPR